jgi:hypothetical protein
MPIKKRSRGSLRCTKQPPSDRTRPTFFQARRAQVVAPRSESSLAASREAARGRIARGELAAARRVVANASRGPARRRVARGELAAARGRVAHRELAAARGRVVHRELAAARRRVVARASLPQLGAAPSLAASRGAARRRRSPRACRSSRRRRTREPRSSSAPRRRTPRAEEQLGGVNRDPGALSHSTCGLRGGRLAAQAAPHTSRKPHTTARAVSYGSRSRELLRRSSGRRRSPRAWRSSGGVVARGEPRSRSERRAAAFGL